ncbi:hypothetical protein HAX54_015563, partial [Datura stramonium]|nr:hypothetical protein [Datura stramonium]
LMADGHRIPDAQAHKWRVSYGSLSQSSSRRWITGYEVEHWAECREKELDRPSPE